MDRLATPRLDSAMIAIDGLAPTDDSVFKMLGFFLVHENFDILAQGSLIALEGEDVVGFLLDDLAGDVALAADRDNGPDRALDCHHVEQRGIGDDLICVHPDLTEHEALASSKGRDYVDRLSRTPLLIGTSRGLAVEGNDIRRRFRQCCDPNDETSLEGLRVEVGENIAKMVMQGGAPGKRQEPTQKVELHRAKSCNVPEAFCRRKHRQKRQQPNLGQRPNHFAALTSVHQTLEYSKDVSEIFGAATQIHTIGPEGVVVTLLVNGRRPLPVARLCEVGLRSGHLYLFDEAGVAI